ncbi:IclR family transcriptional regulator [Pseudonocardia saturnea]
MARTQNGESVLSRAVRILAVFGPDDRTLRMSDIAARSGLHLSTTSRLVAEMVALGLLARDPDRQVRIGVRLWELAARASPTLTLRDTAMPFLEDLHAVVGHHVQLGVLDGSEVLFVERLSAPGAVINYTRIAGRLPLHASSSGLVLLAHAPHELQDAVLAGPLRRYTIATPERLRAVLADVRRTGHAYCAGHIHPDALGIAVPVTTPSREVVAALAAIVPNDESGRAVVPVLMATARGISRSIPDHRDSAPRAGVTAGTLSG